MRKYLIHLMLKEINPVTLLFQTGYLTIDKAYSEMSEYLFRLKVPTQEVRVASSNQFIGGYTDIVEQKMKYKRGLYDTLRQADLEGMTAVTFFNYADGAVYADCKADHKTDTFKNIWTTCCILSFGRETPLLK